MFGGVKPIEFVGYYMLYFVNYHPDIKLVIVMLVVPFVLNVFQFWVSDQFMKQGKVAAAAGSRLMAVFKRRDSRANSLASMSPAVSVTINDETTPGGGGGGGGPAEEEDDNDDATPAPATGDESFATIVGSNLAAAAVRGGANSSMDDYYEEEEESTKLISGVVQQATALSADETSRPLIPGSSNNSGSPALLSSSLLSSGRKISDSQFQNYGGGSGSTLNYSTDSH